MSKKVRKFNVTYFKGEISHSIFVYAKDEDTAKAYLNTHCSDVKIVGCRPATLDDERPSKPTLYVPNDFIYVDPNINKRYNAMLGYIIEVVNDETEARNVLKKLGWTDEELATADLDTLYLN